MPSDALNGNRVIYLCGVTTRTLLIAPVGQHRAINRIAILYGNRRENRFHQACALVCEATCKQGMGVGV